MKNSYLKQIKTLQTRTTAGRSFISIFVPLRSTEIPVERIFLSLVKGANNLLIRDNRPTCTIAPPNWNHFVKQGALSLAIYHHDGVTTFIPMPVKMEPRFIVADSFHIKPLLAASNENLNALLLHFHEKGVSLIRIGATTDYQVDCFLPPLPTVDATWSEKLNKEEMSYFIDYIAQETMVAINDETYYLGISGTEKSFAEKIKFRSKIDLPLVHLNDSFSQESPNNAIMGLRLKLKEKIHTDYLSRVKHFSDQENFDLKDLGTLILDNEIKHLCVSLDDLHFGEVNEKNGEISLNRTQLGIKDDDVLDDLVEMALKRGVKVSVVPKKYLPRGRTYLVSPSI